MKWIGQNIENFISRFQQKVYLESADIEIRKVSGQPTLELSAWSATATAPHAGRIKFLKSGTATVDTYTAGDHTTAGEILGRIEAYGIDDGDGETLSSYIEFANDAISDADSSPGKIVFATSDADDAGTPTVRLTIDDDGLATFVGAISVGGNLTFDSVGLTAIQTSAESFVDNDTSIMTSAAIDDRINTAVTAEDLDVAADSGTAAVDLNSQSLTVTGGTNVTTSATGQAVTINVDDAFIKNNANDTTSGSLTVTGAAGITINDATTSSATEGGSLILISDDEAALGDDHRLGVIGFVAAEDGSSTLQQGASIQAFADAAWSASENGTRLEFSTMDGNAQKELSLTLDSDLLASFAGAVTVTGALTGTLATVSQPNITGVGTIGTGVWEGTAVATDQQKHLAWFKITGFSTGDGTNYDIMEDMTDASAPFEHATSTGSDGLTAQTVQIIMRSGGLVMPRAGTLKRWLGWATCAGSGSTDIALFKITPTRNDNSNVSPVLLDNTNFTALGNAKMEDFDETSFTDADLAAGDIIVSGIRAVNNKTAYFSSTLEIEWD